MTTYTNTGFRPSTSCPSHVIGERKRVHDQIKHECDTTAVLESAQPLIHLSIVEMANPPRDENEHFRLSMAAHQFFEMAAFGALAEHGLALLEDTAPERRERILHVRNL